MSFAQSVKTKAKISDPRFGVRQSERLLILAPVFMVVIVICFSSNFRATGELRSQPLGGDFLQEWTAGQILRSSEASQLYDLDHFRSVQHDPLLTGFCWAESSYFPAVYPPFYYLAMTPLSLFDYPLAIRIWAIFSAIFLVAAFELILRCQPELWRAHNISPTVCVIAIVLFTPVWLNFTMGQKATLILLLFTGTYLLLKNDRAYLAGLLFGLVAFKPHLAVVVGLAFLLRRNWAFVGGATTTLASLTLISMSLGWELNEAFIETTLGSTDYVQTGGYQLAESHNIWGAMALTFGTDSTVTSVATWLLVGIIVAMVSSIAFPAMTRSLAKLDGQRSGHATQHGPASRDSNSENELVHGPADEIRSLQFDLEFATLVFGTVLLSPHFYTYDLVLILLPVLLCYRVSTSSIVPQNHRIVLRGLLVACVLFAGLFSQIAATISFQPSLLILFSILVTLTILNWKHQSEEVWNQLVSNSGGIIQNAS